MIIAPIGNSNSVIGERIPDFTHGNVADVVVHTPQGFPSLLAGNAKLIVRPCPIIELVVLLIGLPHLDMPSALAASVPLLGSSDHGGFLYRWVITHAAPLLSVHRSLPISIKLIERCPFVRRGQNPVPPRLPVCPFGQGVQHVPIVLGVADVLVGVVP